MKVKITLLLVFGIFMSLQAQSLKINEVLASNSTGNVDADGDHEDWIELYNTGTTPINLGGYCLSDDELLLQKWVFPSVTLNAGQYLLVWASEKNRTVAGAPLHTNFKINASGEKVLLSSPAGVIVDSLSSPDVPENISYGRKPNGSGNFFYFNAPTPGSSNNQNGYTELMKAPDFSMPSGFYPSGFELILSTTQPGASIIYTLDGSEPEASNLGGTTYKYKTKYQEEEGQSDGVLVNKSFTSLPYNDPINIIDRSTVNNVIANIATSWHNPVYYIPNFKIFKNTVVRAKVVKAGALASKSVTRNYFITPLGYNRFSLPVASYTVDEDELFDYNNGLYVPGVDFDDWRSDHSQDAGSAADGNYKREGVAEWVGNFSYYVNGEEVINQKLGIELSGNASRKWPSKSIKFSARDEHSKNSLDYNFFNNGYDKFKRILLRNSGTDALTTMFRDAFAQRIVGNLNFPTQAYQPTVTFLNGEYWGIHNLREFYDENYIDRVFGVKGDELDLLEKTGDVEVGDAADYEELMQYVEDNGLVNTANYNYIKTRIDIENFTDYYLAEIYVGNGDWGGSNIRFWRKRTSGYVPDAPYGHDGRYRWLCYDMDGGIGLWHSPTTDFLDRALDPEESDEHVLFVELMKNIEFRNQFINRFADIMNTHFLPSRTVPILDAMQAKIAPEMPEHLARWKSPANVTEWNTQVQEMRDYVLERPAEQREHIEDAFNLSGHYNLTANVSSFSQGYIKVNTIDLLPSTVGVAVNPYPWLGVYFRGIPVTLTAIAKPGYLFSHWSGASSSTNAEITLTPNANVSLTAHFVLDPNAAAQPIYFFVFDGAMPNNQPLESINAKFSASGQLGKLDFQSSLQGYPFTAADPLWRKASMERRNNPADLNYRQLANNNLDFVAADVKGLQIRQPFVGSAGENAMIFSLPTNGYKNCVFTFAAINELAADQLIVDYSINGSGQWTTTGMSQSVHPLSANYQLFTIGFTAIDEVNNNPNFKIRIRFAGSDMTADLGNRVTFNNMCLDGQIYQAGVSSQDITFPAIADMPYNAAPFTLNATASSALPIVYTIVSGPASVVNSTVTLTGVLGTVTVKASQPGNANFSPAPEVIRTFQVTKASQTISFPSLSSKLTTDLPFNITATASSGLPVSFSIVSGPATVFGNTITLLGTSGSVTVRASQAGNSQYNPASNVTKSFNVQKVAQNISLTPVPDKFTNAAPFNITASASSGLPVSFTILSGPATVFGSTVTVSGTPGQVVFRAAQPGNDQYSAASSVIDSFKVIIASQAINFPAISNKLTTQLPFPAGATASSGLPITYTLVSGPATIVDNIITLTGDVGTVVITASQIGDNQYLPAADITISFEVVRATQTISFATIPDKVTIDAPFVLDATATSGLDVSYEVVSGPATIQNNLVTLTGIPGTVVIRATQAGNGDFNAAVDVVRSFLVSKASQTINFALIPNKAVTDQPFALVGSASSGLPIVYSIVSGPATVVGNIVTLLGTPGVVVVKAQQAGNDQYNAAIEATQSFTISLLAQTITFASISNKNISDVPFFINASASSGLPVTFTVISGPATIFDNQVTLDGVIGVVSIRATQAGDAQYGPATEVIRTFIVVGISQSISFSSIPDKITTDAPFNLNATATSGLSVIYAVVSGPATIQGATVTLTGFAGEVVISASQSGNSLYNAANNVTRSFDVEKAIQTISFASIPNKITTDVPFDAVVSATSGLAINLVVISGPATVSGNTITLTGTSGTVTLRAKQDGNDTYKAASDVTRSFDVDKASQSISFDAITNKITTDAPFAANVSASSGLAIDLSIVSGPATVFGTTITLTGVAGTVTLRAKQIGNSTYQSATEVLRTFEVEKATQNIDFDLIADKITTDVPFDVVVSASSGLNIELSVVSGPATVSGTTITLTGAAGTVTLLAEQSGDDTYHAAAEVIRTFEVIKVAQSITFDAIGNKITTDAPFDATVSSTSGLNVELSVVSGPATVSGTTITLTGAAGTVTIKAEQTGNSTYQAATEIIHTFEVAKAVQSLVFEAISNKYTTDLPFDVQVSASSSLPVALVLVSGPATLTGNTITLQGTAGTVVISANQPGNDTYSPSMEVLQSFEVQLAPQSINFPALPDRFTNDAPFAIEATATSGLPVTLELISGPATIVGNTITLAAITGIVTIKATQLGNTQYGPAMEVIHTFNVICTTVDADGDGICADADCNDNNPAYPAIEGSACDDGDPFTTNDAIQADGCTCAGTVSMDTIISEYGIKISPNPTLSHIIVSSNEPFVHAQVLSTTSIIVWQQSYMPGSAHEIIDMNALPSGTYMLILQYHNGTRAITKVIKTN